jgi:hypothetical protein
MQESEIKITTPHFSIYIWERFNRERNNPLFYALDRNVTFRYIFVTVKKCYLGK